MPVVPVILVAFLAPSTPQAKPSPAGVNPRVIERALKRAVNSLASAPPSASRIPPPNVVLRLEAPVCSIPLKNYTPEPHIDPKIEIHPSAPVSSMDRMPNIMPAPPCPGKW